MRVALVEPDIKPTAKTIFVGNNALEPLGLEYLGGVALARGWTPKLFVERLLGTRLLEAVRDFGPHVVAFTSLTCNSDRMLSLAADVHRQVDCKVVVGGYHASAVPEELAEQPFVDWVIVGEGETAFGWLLDSIEGSKGLLAEGKIVRGPRIPTFDGLPRPYRDPDILDRCRILGLFFPPFSQQHRAAVVSTSRGCSNNCDFCAAKSVWGTSAAVLRHPDDVVSELHELVERYGVDAVLFSDLSFNTSASHLRGLCEAIIRSNLRFSWYCMCCMEGLREDVLSLMACAGCRKIGIGIESPLYDVRRKIKKGYVAKNDELLRVVSDATANGIFVKAYFMAGYPWENSESLAEFADALLPAQYDEIKISFFTPFPGTQAYADYGNRLIAQDWSAFDTVSQPVLENSEVTRGEIIEWRQNVFTNYYTSPSYRERVRMRCSADPGVRQSYVDFAGQLEASLDMPCAALLGGVQ